MMSDKELIEQLAKEHGYVNKWPSPNHCGSTYSVQFSSNQLEAFAKAYAQTQGQSNWISVDDRLPKGEESVLITYDGKVDKTCMAYGEWLMPSKRQIESITHWMPLPAPPGCVNT
jgi:hypothetical protein